MRIANVRREGGAGVVRSVADVAFEEADRPGLSVYFEVDEQDADALWRGAEPFAVALFPAASWHGERRVAVDGPLCGELRTSLEDHARVLTRWYGRCAEPRMEATGGFTASRPAEPTRTAMMLTGGIDALASLRRNRLDVPPDHPHAIRTGIWVFGLSARHAPGGVEDPERRRGYERHLERLRVFGRGVGLDVVSVRTNLLHAYEGWESWRDAGFGAGTAAAGHALGRRYSRIVFNSSGAGLDTSPHASHPLLDDRLSSGAVRVVSGLPYRSRLEKVALVAAWPEALEILRPCLVPGGTPPETLNCGHCEKCVRTMLELAAVGALERAPAFRRHRLTAADLHANPPRGRRAIYYDDVLVEALEAHGRPDLADAVRYALERLRLTPWQRRIRKWRRSLEKRLPSRRRMVPASRRR
jgi:hypothetical protein